MVYVVHPRAPVKVVALRGRREAARWAIEVLRPRRRGVAVVHVRLDAHAVDETHRDVARTALEHVTPFASGGPHDFEPAAIDLSGRER